jgi:hypothetical protein
MRYQFTIIAFIFCIPLLFSQQRETVVVKGEAYLESELPREMLYSFTEFREATLIRKDGVENQTRVNLNLFTGDILFLSPANQVLVLAYPKDVDRIKIGSDLWLPVEDTFGEVINRIDEISLVKVKKTRITDTRRESGFGGMSSTTSTKAITQFSANNQGQVALPLGEYDFETSVTYRLFDGSRMIIADAKGFRKLFPAKKKEIKAYLKANDVDFKNEDHLKAFMEKCIAM